MNRLEGFIYVPEFLSVDEERRLVHEIQQLPFSEVRMHGVSARRRVIHFGWEYGYDSWRLTAGPELPGFLEPLRERAAELASVQPAELAEILITEYTPGSPIGWHRDAPMFGIVVAISLSGTARLRFRRGKGASMEASETQIEPRSAYVLTGEARSVWQHSIPPVKALRYSITFRTLKSPEGSAKQPE